ncbi:MAG: hypothetical protein ACOYN0_04515 [Phycisphaerales bacterium]
MAPMVSSEAGEAGVFSPLALDEADSGLLARNDARLGAGGGFDASAGAQVPDMRASRRVRLSTDSATYMYYTGRVERE